MAREQLSTILDRAWEVVPLARQVQAELSRGGRHARRSADDVEHRLIRLADGLRRCEQPLPARLAQVLATAIRDIAHESVLPSASVLDGIRQGLDRLCDLLVELDAIGQITRAESADAIERLESTITLPSAEPSRGEEDSAAELVGYGDALVLASESLLTRIQRDAESPYAASVSRIHHLAVTMRNRLAEVVRDDICFADPQSSWIATSCPSDAGQSAVNIDEMTVMTSPSEPIVAAMPLAPLVVDSAESPAPPMTRARRVLVIDESPFFRMLLGTAIESAGYATQVAMNLDEVLAAVGQDEPCGVVVWGGAESHTQTTRLVEWMRRPSAVPRAALIAVVDGRLSPSEVSPEFDSLVSRTDPSALLKIVAAALGDVAASTRKIA